MAMWVAPSVAAEIWGTNVQHILACVADGSIPSYVDAEFLFVDVEGRGMPICTPPSAVEPVVTPQEIAALTHQPIEPAEESVEEPQDESGDISDWREVRERTARRRQPPAEAA
jgi:hypothetical protein